jgi:hypothetical protein
MRRSLAVILCSAVLLMPTSASAAIHVKWHTDEGIRLIDVATGPDGSIYVVGDRRTSITAKAFLAKLAPDGTRLWRRSWLPNPQASTNAAGVALLPGGNIAWTGDVQQQCEGNGWFVQVNRPNGSLVRRYVTPGWQCSIAETVTDIAARSGRIFLSGFKHGCCADFYEDGFVQALDATAHRRWRTNVEPPAPTPHSFFDAADGIAVGSSGNVYVSGWGATRPMRHETSPIRGTAMLWKLMPSGGVVFSHRIKAAPMPSIDTPVTIGVRGKAVMVSAGVRGSNVRWHASPTDGWLGRFTTDGSLVWSSHWDVRNPHAAQPAGVAIDGKGRTWVVGTRRIVAGHGLALFVRRYGPGGGLLDKDTARGGARYLHGTGVATRGAGALVTSWFGNNNSRGGRLWRYAVT